MCSFISSRYDTQCIRIDIVWPNGNHQIRNRNEAEKNAGIDPYIMRNNNTHQQANEAKKKHVLENLFIFVVHPIIVASANDDDRTKATMVLCKLCQEQSKIRKENNIYLHRKEIFDFLLSKNFEQLLPVALLSVCYESISGRTLWNYHASCMSAILCGVCVCNDCYMMAQQQRLSISKVGTENQWHTNYVWQTDATKNTVPDFR